MEAGAADRLRREGTVHTGIELQFDRERHRIALSELAAGRSIVIYGQTEIVKDLIAARLGSGSPLLFEAEDVVLTDLTSATPKISFSHNGAKNEFECDFVAGCDGFHGVSRSFIPTGVLSSYSRDYPFAWLGILAEVPPSNDCLLYTSRCV